MTQKNKLILVGVISTAHGIRGEVAIKSFTDPIENIVNLKIIDENQNNLELRLKKKKSNNLIICQVMGLKTRNEAESLKNVKLFCLRSEMPQTKSDEFYFEDLIGMKVFNINNIEIASVVGIFNFGAGDIIEIKYKDTQKKEMVEFTEKNFPQIYKDKIYINDKRC